MAVKVTSKDFGYAVKFLKKNGYTEENKSEYHIEKQGSSITLYKKVDVLTLS